MSKNSATVHVHNIPVKANASTRTAVDTLDVVQEGQISDGKINAVGSDRHADV